MALRNDMELMTFTQQLRILDVVDQVRQEVGLTDIPAARESIINEIDAIEAAEGDALYA